MLQLLELKDIFIFVTPKKERCLGVIGLQEKNLACFPNERLYKLIVWGKRVYVSAANLETSITVFTQKRSIHVVFVILLTISLFFLCKFANV